jgi:hypothetical protein
MRRFGRAAVGLTVSAVVLAGCGSGGDPGASSAAKPAVLDPGALVAASYTKLTDQKTAKLDLTMKLTASGTDGGEYTFTGTGAQDFQHKSARLVMTLPENAGEIETRLIDRTVYEKLPASQAPALKGKWPEFNLDKVAAAAGLGVVGQGSPSDPTQILQMLEDISNQVTRVGDEQVRGVHTTHYRAVVDLAKASAKAGNTAQQIDRLKQMLGTSSYPVDIWIDDAGLPHRLQFQMPLPKQLTQGSGVTDAKMVATEDLYDFGTPVDVQAPPADQTVDGSQLTGGTGGTGTAHA